MAAPGFQWASIAWKMEIWGRDIDFGELEVFTWLMLEEGEGHQISLVTLSNSTGLGVTGNRAKRPLQNKLKDKDLFIYPEGYSLAVTQESIPSHPWVKVLQMCFRSWVVGPALRPLPGPSPNPPRGDHPWQVLISEVLLHRLLLHGGFPGSL